MSVELPTVGKISPEAFEHFVFPHLGAPSDQVLFGPQSGVDVGVFRVAPGVVMATTTDPVFVVPQYGWERASWFAVHILASDAATSGLKPQWMTVDLNLPLTMTTADFETFWLAWDRAAKALGITIISGHTARYDGCAFPMVGGATVMSVGPEDQFVTTAMAEAGDWVLCTKGAAIEATALFAATFPEWIRHSLGDDVYRAADALFEQMSVVRDAEIAAQVGVRTRGVTAMHDATECGVVGGVYEIAECSNLGVELVDDDIIVRPEVAAVTQLVGIDPLISISEGTLLLTVKPHACDRVCHALEDAGISVSVIGRMLPREQGRWRISRGERRPLEHPRIDPFWAAFGERMTEGVR
ncbi:MAG: AIR synthase family protein [Firmicutes bacterium]|nr:AIR synthase family protein [Bacillota bacterium]